MESGVRTIEVSNRGDYIAFGTVKGYIHVFEQKFLKKNIKL